VCEHASFTFLLYGISRSASHECVRHRAGTSFSQLSQRYVDGKKLRFVERPEYQNDQALHTLFEARIDNLKEQYEEMAGILMRNQQEGAQQLLDAERKTDLKKKVNQTARSVLPNETETTIVMTANARAWRHFINLRATEAAEVEIRELAYRIWCCLKEISPLIFNDYEVITLKDGTRGLTTKYKEV